MTTLIPEKEPAAIKIVIRDDKLIVDLADGRTLVPLEWYPRLLHAGRKERQNWTLLGNGYAIEWPDLDEHIGVNMKNAPIYYDVVGFCPECFALNIHAF